jgi:hypothetical protein
VSPERWTSEPAPLADLPPEELAALRRRARLGAILLGLGVAGMLWGALHLLLAVGGPEQADFAHRPRYDEVKPLVQQAMFGALLRAVVGLFLAMAGGSLRGAALRRLHGRAE